MAYRDVLIGNAAVGPRFPGLLLCVVAKSITARGGNICLPHCESDGQSSQYAADVRGTANADAVCLED